MTTALLCALAHQIGYILDNLTSTQCFTRPIVLGSLTGLLCGDLKTGIIMGAELEAIFMGISQVGGVAATDYRVSTIVAVAFVITAGASQELGLSLAVTVGALINATKPIPKAIKVMYYPIFTKLHQSGNYKGFIGMFFLDGLVLKNLFETLIVFFGLAFGTDILTLVIARIPEFVLNGLNVASGMLVVVGLCLVTLSLWGTYTPVYILIGFILSKFLGLEITVIALIALAIAVLGFKQSKEINELKNLELIPQSEEGEDFYD